MGKSSAWILQKTYNPLSQPDLHPLFYGVIKYLHETDPRALNHHKLPVRIKEYFSSSNSVTYIVPPLMSPG